MSRLLGNAALLALGALAVWAVFRVLVDGIAKKPEEGP